MKLQVLVPFHSEKHFGQQRGLDLDPIYYRFSRETTLQIVLRKAGLRDLRQSLESRVKIEGGIKRMDQVVALWLSSEAYLPPIYMNCLLDLLPALKWMYSQVTGTEHLDLEEFKKRGVMVSNNGNENSRRVAEMALACVCAHAKRLPGHLGLQRKRQWRGLPTDELSRQTVGIIGTGNIGRNVAHLCRAIGMRVVGASRDPARFGDDCSPYHRLVCLEGELDSLLAEADHVIVATPLNEKTRGLLGRAEFVKMKKTATLVNVARGAIVDEAELCNALAQGEIAAAYIDRPSQLPVPYWSKMYRTPNLVLTHYSAAHNPQHAAESFERFLNGLRALSQNGQPADRVI